MVIQTCSEAFTVLMQMENQSCFSADAINTLLARDESAANCSQTNLSSMLSNDLSNLPLQK